jgi:hypothetical protein
MRIQGTSWSSTQSAVSGVELLRHVMRHCSCNLLHQQMPATLIAWHNPSSHRLPRQFGHRATRCGSNSRRQHRRPPTLGTASACLGDLLVASPGPRHLGIFLDSSARHQPATTSTSAMATHKLSAILIKYFTTFVYSYGDHLGLRDFRLLYDFPALFFLPFDTLGGLA